MLQCNLNTNPEDALLIDNSKSYFQNVGYTRTSCFQMELKDVDPQNTANLGATVNFVIPKGADLMNQLDLMVEFAQPTNACTSAAGQAVGWVDSIGHAMIDKVTFSVGTTPLEELTGEQLHIINELMRDDKHRYGFEYIGKTGRPLLRSQCTVAGGSAVTNNFVDSNTDADTYDRIISYYDGSANVKKEGKKLIVPLGLFFTKHPSAAFPICAIAGVNDIRVQIKFRPQNELIVLKSNWATANGIVTAASDAGTSPAAPNFPNGVAFKTCQLRVHYYHVTGPEATSLMNREHVRLMKMYTGNSVSKQFSIAHTAAGTQNVLSIPLSFLYPVQELIITIRKVSEARSASLSSVVKCTDVDQLARGKNLFAYHGAGHDPNLENPKHDTEENPSSGQTKALVSLPYLKTQNLKLTINGQTRHLDGQGIDRDYLMKRMMPMLHSNKGRHFENIHRSSMKMVSDTEGNGALMEPADDIRALSQMMDQKEIYVFPFSIAPESPSPSGHVNFSKVSHASLDIKVDGFDPAQSGSTPTTVEYQVDVYGQYYNWLAIKQGRAMLSFA